MNKIIIAIRAVLTGAIGGVVSGGKFIYNKFHYDEDGFNLFGFDKEGYDRNGYDKSGYDRQGYDQSGYDKTGFNQSGFDKEGFDQSGYDKNGYNKSGLDKGNLSVNDYRKILFEMNELHNKAYNQMKKGDYGYALHDIRIGLEKGVKCVISHLIGSFNMNNSLDDNITICKNSGLLERDFVEKLYNAKRHCNDAQHDSNVKKEYNQVYFSYKVFEELVEKVQAMCVQ